MHCGPFAGILFGLFPDPLPSTTVCDSMLTSPRSRRSADDPDDMLTVALGTAPVLVKHGREDEDEDEYEEEEESDEEYDEEWDEDEDEGGEDLDELDF